MHRMIWLLIAALAACTNAYGPKDSTQTGNPPILDDGRVSLEVSADEVHITGKPAAAKPSGATIEITNLTTSKVITGMAAADGSFDIRVDGSVNDTFAVRLLADGKESQVVYVVRGGALVDDGSLSCGEYAELAGAMVAGAIAFADTSCESDSDCVTTGRATACTDACSDQVVSRAGKAMIEAAVAEINGAVCKGFKDAGCRIEGLPCVPPQPSAPRCSAGQCKLVPITMNEDPPSCVSCFTETLQWGLSGGLVAYTDQSELAPCAHYTHRRLTRANPDAVTMACEGDLVACNAVWSTGAVMTAVAQSDVQDALAASPVVYGIDPRGADGNVFEIVLGRKIINVGGPCRDTAPTCVPIPPGVQALVDVLRAIDQQMLSSDECAAFLR
jgi:hypothetical protein